ncbi:hypothetical protein MMC31_005716 [Peltigera leucophlebia]|nr:hypothetical protein [Peltigera leucophlebia]
MEAQLLFFSRSCKDMIWQFKSIPISRAYLDSAKPVSPSPTATDGYSWRILESLIDELKIMCVEGWKLHLLEKPQLLNLDCRDKHYFAKVILTRELESPATTTTTSTSIAIDTDSDSEDETDHRLLRENWEQ